MLIHLVGATHSWHLTSVSSHRRWILFHLFDLLCTLLSTRSTRVYAGIITIVYSFEATLIAQIDRMMPLLVISLLLARVEPWSWLWISWIVIFSVYITSLSFLSIYYSELFTHLNQIFERFLWILMLAYADTRFVIVLIFCYNLQTF